MSDASDGPKYKRITHYNNIYVRRLHEYEAFFGVKGKYEIWLVDGKRIRRRWDGDFVYGGSDRRYTFIPKNEIWIDSEVSLAEAIYTVEHELIERELMDKGMIYDQAHEEAKKSEEPLRDRDNEEAEIKSSNAKPSAPYVFDIDDPKEPFPWEKSE
jgi:hypothetical protein